MNVPRTTGICLAAGNSTRMRTDKRALPFANYSLDSTALQEAVSSSLSDIFVIVRQDNPLDWITSELLRHEKCTIIRCTALSGQTHSLRCGIREAIRRHAEAVVVLLAN